MLRGVLIAVVIFPLPCRGHLQKMFGIGMTLAVLLMHRGQGDTGSCLHATRRSGQLVGTSIPSQDP